jgi:hypothetical protein
MIDLLPKGAVRIGDIEQEVHYTPTSQALRAIASIITGYEMSTLNFIQGLVYLVTVPYPDTTVTYTSDYVWLQTTSSTTPGYIYGWQWVTITGLTGYIGTAVGFAFSGMFTSTMSGTLSGIKFVGGCYWTTDEYGNPVLYCADLFTVGLSMLVFSGSTIQFYSTIVAGLSGWSVIARTNYTGTISTVIPNMDFLRNIAMLFLPFPVASLSYVAPRRYIATLSLSGYNVGASVSLGTVQLIYYGSVYLTQAMTISTISWIGQDTLYITYPTISTLYLYNTLTVVLSTPMVLGKRLTHYFTLLITFTS